MEQEPPVSSRNAYDRRDHIDGDGTHDPLRYVRMSDGGFVLKDEISQYQEEAERLAAENHDHNGEDRLLQMGALGALGLLGAGITIAWRRSKKG